MKILSYFTLPAAIALAVVATGCASGSNSVGVTNQQQPGPAIGRAVGSGVGAVVGNVAGAGAGVVEGTAGGIHSTFNNTQRVVRYWREEKTTDGRIIFVPVDFLVDANGEVIRQVR
ncbi:MAG: flagellar motor protein MotB [Limisphaerales bacterium]